jgi:DnaJ-class molecular chaperone
MTDAWIECPHCGGTGRERDNEPDEGCCKRCIHCDGYGNVRRPAEPAPVSPADEVKA